MKRFFCLNIGSLFLTCLMLGSGAQAAPLFQVESKVGLNEGHIGKGRFSKYNSKEMRIGAHQIMGSYPFSLGFSLGREMVHTSSLAFSRSGGENGQIRRQATNYAHNDELAVELQAWMPDSMTGGRVRPFIKAGHTVWSNYQSKAKLIKDGKKEPFTETGLEQGASLAMGSQIKVNSEYSALFEFRYQQRSILIEDAGVMQKRKTKAGGALLGVTRFI
ncbi:MAG: hypothetical protein HRU09_13350 [Oligoflexales bacterium]|nr:hypothetical protein [Oligoflexales bacterium]